MVLIGFDPGGRNSFGWAVLEIASAGNVTAMRHGVVSSAPDAVDMAARVAGEPPAGVGIDAPLFWVDSGDRRVDGHIRRRVITAGGSTGTVNAINSLRGACLAQGIIAARLSTRRWPNSLVTEAHPKALLQIWPDAQEFVRIWMPSTASTHERDAVLAAYAAWQGVSTNPSWRDLVILDEAPFFPSGGRITYWFPV